MGSHNEVLAIRQEATRRQQCGSNQPLDIAFRQGEPYNFKISEDDIAMILRALSSECLNNQQHRLIEAIQSMFRPNGCCQADNCYDKVMDEVVRSLILQRQSMEGYTGCWRTGFCMEHTIANWYEALVDKNGIMVFVEVDKALRLQILLGNLGEPAQMHLIHKHKLMLSEEIVETSDEAGRPLDQFSEFTAFDKYFQWLRAAGIPYNTIFIKRLGLYELYPTKGPTGWCSARQDRLVHLENDFQENNKQIMLIRRHEDSIEEERRSKRLRMSDNEDDLDPSNKDADMTAMQT
jgi:hypothetical protein